MRRWSIVLAVLAGLLGCTTAIALPDTHYVSASGVASWTASTNSGTPCSLPTANANADSGDTVLLLPGTYVDVIEPARGGTSQSWLRYMGLVGHSESVTVAAIHVGSSITRNSLPRCGQYTSVSWVTTTGECGLHHWVMNNGTHMQAMHDSLDHVVVNSTRPIVVNGHDGVLSACSGTAGNFEMRGTDNNYQPLITIATNNKIVNCNFILTVPDNFSPVLIRTATDNVIQSSRFTVRAGSVLSGNTPLWGMYRVQRMLIQDTHIEIENNSQTSVVNFVMRDSSQFCRFVRDTLIATGTANATFQLSSQGTAATANGVRHNRYDQCVFKVANADPGAAALWYQNGAREDTLQFCTVVAGNTAPALLIPTIPVPGLVISHNSLYSGGRSVFQMRDLAAAPARFTSNILYSATAPMCGIGSMAYYAGPFAARDSNLFFSAGGADSSKAIFAGASGSCRAPSVDEPRSFWRSPRFRDSSYTTTAVITPDLRLGKDSWAMGTQWQDHFVGADVPLPAPVNDLAVLANGRTTVVVGWNTPFHVSDDGATYELRIAPFPITTAYEFQLATPVVSGAAGEPGQAECVSLTQMDSCRTRYYAVRLTSRIGSSGVGNTPKSRTLCMGKREYFCAGSEISMSSLAESGEGEDEPRLEFGLDLPYPNPAAGDATLAFSIPAGLGSDAFTLGVFDLAGRRLAEVAAGPASAGRRSFTWDGRARDGSRVRPGTYFVRLDAGPRVMTRTLVMR